MAYQRINVRASDTLRGLAQRYLGDHRRWIEIVLLNDLTEDQYELAGITSLLVPITQNTGQSTQSPYRIDIATDADGGIMLGAASGIATRSGVDNVKSATVRAISTTMRSYIAAYKYGLNLARYASQAGTPLYLRFLKVEVERVIRRDPRISDVLNLALTQKTQSRRVQITGRALLIGGEHFDFFLDREV